MTWVAPSHCTRVLTAVASPVAGASAEAWRVSSASSRCRARRRALPPSVTGKGSSYHRGAGVAEEPTIVCSSEAWVRSDASVDIASARPVRSICAATISKP